MGRQVSGTGIRLRSGLLLLALVGWLIGKKLNAGIGYLASLFTTMIATYDGC
ncbi:hypothetical protein ARMGADRAFT_1018103 [Armillaria gallica]|uniref:Uncharacterized protein n=1 Tax=Armillaria gallica TaxID=47427 RepID=A0A2H3D327_ARMGA|nr:hypothetical protein ARMGADRAFT_1018103 [Armillaria gallica]